MSVYDVSDESSFIVGAPTLDLNTLPEQAPSKGTALIPQPETPLYVKNCLHHVGEGHRHGSQRGHSGHLRKAKDV